MVDAVAGGWALAGITTWNPKGTPVLLPPVDGGSTAPGAALRWSLANHSVKRSGVSYQDALVINGNFAGSSAQGVLNPNAFMRTPNYCFSNAPVMFPNLRNPGSFFTDASILKKFYLGDSRARYFEARIEALNILNHPVFGTIINDLGLKCVRRHQRQDRPARDAGRRAVLLLVT